MVRIVLGGVGEVGKPLRQLGPVLGLTYFLSVLFVGGLSLRELKWELFKVVPCDRDLETVWSGRIAVVGSLFTLSCKIIEWTTNTVPSLLNNIRYLIIPQV